MKDKVIKYFLKFYNEFVCPVQVFNHNGDLVFVNQAFSTQWNYELSELISYNIFNDSILNKLGNLAEIKKAFEDNKNIEINEYFDSLLKDSNKSVPIYKTQIFPLTLDNETHFIFIHQDKTEVFLANAELKKARDTSKEAERLKNTFLNVLSHELRTPLNIILGYSSIIKDSLKDKISSEEQVYLENLYNGSERLFKSISQMLEFAQLDAGNFQISIDTIDLIHVIQSCVLSLKQHALNKKIDLKTNIKDERILVDTDQHCIESAINNLLNNALKFTPQGFIEIETGIMKEHELAFCKIRDSGVGISSEYLDHLYTPFSQENLELNRNYEGNGLGLALTKRYVEKLGGSLVVDSIKGVGSTFTITLPLSKKTKLKESEPLSINRLKAIKILMLDESGETSELVKVFLKDAAEIHNHKHGKFITHLFKNEDYSLVLLDVNLNQWYEGLALCKEINKKDPYKRPVIILSGETDKNKINDFYQTGASKFIIKPFNKSDLLESISSILS